MPYAAWPRDRIIQQERTGGLVRQELTCLFLSPSEPTGYWDDIFVIVDHICGCVAAQMGVPLECRRLAGAATDASIKSNPWAALVSSDLIVADITGRDGIVMFELGVASACVDKRSVVILAENLAAPPIFDIHAACQIGYVRSREGFQQLVLQLLPFIQRTISQTAGAKSHRRSG